MRWKPLSVTTSAAISAVFVDVACGSMPETVYQSSHKRQLGLESRATRSSNCSCLNWKDTYSSGAVRCGWGREFFSFAEDAQLPVEHVLPFAPVELCDGMFERLDASHCIRGDVDLNWSQPGNLLSRPRSALGERLRQGNGSQYWCYVSESCEERRSASSSGDDASIGWKTCSSSDSLLGDMSPEELRMMSDKHDINFGQLLAAAYATEPELWEEVEQGMWLGDFVDVSGRLGDAAEPVEPSTPQLRRPVVYDVRQETGGDKVVATSTRFWAANRQPTAGRGNAYNLECLSGCGAAESTSDPWKVSNMDGRQEMLKLHRGDDSGARSNPANGGHAVVGDDANADHDPLLQLQSRRRQTPVNAVAFAASGAFIFAGADEHAVAKDADCEDGFFDCQMQGSWHGYLRGSKWSTSPLWRATSTTYLRGSPMQEAPLHDERHVNWPGVHPFIWRSPEAVHVDTSVLNLGCRTYGTGADRVVPWYRGAPGAVVGGIAYVTIALTLVGADSCGSSHGMSVYSTNAEGSRSPPSYELWTRQSFICAPYFSTSSTVGFKFCD